MTNMFPTDDLNDSLDDLFNSPMGEVRTATKAPAGFVENKGFIEGCPKCGGKGRVYSNRSGRLLGTCFNCKGKGTLTFKQPKAVREKKAAAAAAKKSDAAVAALRAFEIAHPAEWMWIITNLGSFDFAKSMWEAIQKFSSLTDRQLEAIQKCIARKSEKKEAAIARVQNAPVIDVAKIEEAFATAASKGLRRIKVRVANFRFTPAPSHGNNSGAIYVKEGDRYLGKIKQGKFLCVGGVDAETEKKVIEIAADPKAAAIAHGKEYGVCSCCGAELSNKESIELGIGPICASNMGW